MKPSRHHRQAGFTLVEAIMAIVITGILAGIVAVFISGPIQGYVDSVRRAELTDAADVALRRMTRDIRLALPNSLRVSSSSDCVEFIMTSAGGRYRDEGDGSTGGNFLDFSGTLSNPSCPGTPSQCFDVLGTMPGNPAIAANDYIVIYNLGPGYKPVDAYCSMDPTTCPGGAPTGGNVALVNAIAGNTVTLASNPFAAQSPPLPSPSARFQVVQGGTKAVSYVCSGNQLKRHANYGFNAVQACPPAGTGATLAGSSTTSASCTFDYTSAATGRNGLLFVQLTVTSGGESVTLFQQIHVDNAP